MFFTRYFFLLVLKAKTLVSIFLILCVFPIFIFILLFNATLDAEVYRGWEKDQTESSKDYLTEKIRDTLELEEGKRKSNKVKVSNSILLFHCYKKYLLWIIADIDCILRVSPYQFSFV